MIKQWVLMYRRRKLAEKILCAFIQNPEKHKDDTETVKSMEMSQDDMDNDNIQKSFKLADDFLIHE